MQNRIKELRKALRVNQTTFAKELGVTPSAVCNWESGFRTPPASVILLICKEFNVSRDWIESGNGDMFEKDDLSDAQRARRLVGDLFALLSEEKQALLYKAVKNMVKQQENDDEKDDC